MSILLLRLALLWYHTIVRQFFAMDGEQDDVGMSSISTIYTHTHVYIMLADDYYGVGRVCYLLAILLYVSDYKLFSLLL